MAGVVDCLRCPHCLEALDYLEEPKRLPCSHTFCTPCLESLAIATDKGVSVTCSICGYVQLLPLIDIEMKKLKPQSLCCLFTKTC